MCVCVCDECTLHLLLPPHTLQVLLQNSLPSTPQQQKHEITPFLSPLTTAEWTRRTTQFRIRVSRQRRAMAVLLWSCACLRQRCRLRDRVVGWSIPQTLRSEMSTMNLLIRCTYSLWLFTSHASPSSCEGKELPLAPVLSGRHSQAPGLAPGLKPLCYHNT